MKREVNYSNWREELREVVDVPPIEPKTPKTPRREVKENEKVNNKVVINPTMAEANEVFKELGGTVIEIQETEMNMSSKQLELLQRKAKIDQDIAKERTNSLKKIKVEGAKKTGIDVEKADMGEVIDDFKKSDAPQFKGKSKEKRREMAIAAKLQANEDISDAMNAVTASLPKKALMKGGTRKPVSPEEKRRRYTNYLKNTKKDDPYRSRPGESD